ncbi:MAG TPA: hypothetical protein VFN29_02955 [Chiayiivirga sp.]|nr:hypothetical protein [Chiayiivirga sp.]
MDHTRQHKAIGTGFDLALLILGVVLWLAACLGLMLVMAREPSTPEPVSPARVQSVPDATPPSTASLQVDEAFGVALHVRALRRIVQVLQWREVASVPLALGDEVLRDEGAYQLLWSERLIDSSRFAQPDGHVNPPAPPYRSAGIGPSELLGVDADAQRGWTAVPAADVHLPENLAAVFRQSGVWLVTTPENDLPQAGDLRVRFEVLPAGGAVPASAPEVRAVEASADVDVSQQAVGWIARAAGFLLAMVGAGLALQGAVRRSHPKHWLARIPSMGVLAVSAWLAVLAVLLALAVVRWL